MIIKMIVTFFYSAALLISFFTLAFAQSQEDGLVSSKIDFPIQIGYRIGDVFSIEMNMKMGEGWVVNKSSLPKPKRINRWIELQSVHSKSTDLFNASHQNFRLNYLIIGNPDKLTAVTVPFTTFDLISEGNTWPIVIEPWSFSLSPILLHEDRVEGQMPEIMAAESPALLNLNHRFIKIAFAGFVILLCILYMLAQFIGLPFLERYNRPFAKGSRLIAPLSRQPLSDESYRKALEYFHIAMKETSGETVFSADIDTFFINNPQFFAQKDTIKRVFDASNAEFFDYGTKDVRIDLKAELLPLCRQCAKIESRR